MPQDRHDGGAAVENRWWVDTGKTKERARAVTSGERPPVGSKFFDIGYEFDQESARARLTDLNLKILEEARPPLGGWAVVRMVPNECVPVADLDRMKQRLSLPQNARGVIVDCGRTVRFIITGEPVGERILDFTLGEESSFDCWIRGDWVHEELFSTLDEALRKARPYVGQYLESRTESW